MMRYYLTTAIHDILLFNFSHNHVNDMIRRDSIVAIYYILQYIPGYER